jgi:hypothetical protein
MVRKRALIVIVGAIGLVALGATPAFAHNATVTGTVTCTPAGNQLVTWYNQQNAATWGPATITSSSRVSVATGQVIPPTGLVQVGSEAFGAAATGTISLTEGWRWDATHTDTDTGSVTLGIDCTQPTSPPPTSPPPTSPPPTSPPPTSPPPTTTAPPSTSSTPPSGTGSSTTTGPPSATSGSTTPGTAFTGMSSAPLIGLGAFLILGLAALAISRRKVDEA